MPGLSRLVKALIDDDTELCHSKTQDGRTALHIAAENGKDEVICILLTHKQWAKLKPIVDTQDKQGRTALHAAVELGNLQAVQLLVNAGACVEIESRTGTTPILTAVENRWDEVAGLMSRQMGPKKKKYLTRFLYWGSGAKRLEKHSNGRTPLHAAAEAGSLVWATALLSVRQS